MVLNKEKIKSILVISLSNIGDIVLTFPVIDILRNDFPQAKLSVLIGPKGETLFKGNKNIDEVVVYHKRQSLDKTISWLWGLRNKHFDLVVDLRNSAMPFFMSARYRTSWFLQRTPTEHMRFQHLKRLREVYTFPELERRKLTFSVDVQDANIVKEFLNRERLERGKFVVVNPGAADPNKRWMPARFAQVCDALMEQYRVKIVFVGDQNDAVIVQEIQKTMTHPTVNAAGQLTLTQLGALYGYCWLAMGNDSAPLHLASYLDIPVLGLFGPTEPVKYGPWSSQAYFLRKNQECLICQSMAKGRQYRPEHTCMEGITAQDILQTVATIDSQRIRPPQQFKRILVVRTDRIGDVVLTTPAVRALRQNFPQAYIAMLVSPANKALVLGNPNIDEVLVDDRYHDHQGLGGFFKLVQLLKARKFDVVLNFIPKRRNNLLCFLAGIPKRIAFHNDKFFFLLTDKIPDIRPKGIEHEAQYCLELLKAVGINTKEVKTSVALQADAEDWAENFLRANHLDPQQLVAIHPGASAPSKMWPAKKFAQLMNLLAAKYACQFVLIGAEDMLVPIDEIKRSTQVPIWDLVGKTSVAQLTSLLKRCRMLISNDSGPVHIADALGVPVVSIFTRNQPGINPERWRPLGVKARTVAVPVRTDLSFAKGEIADLNYLELIKVEEVLEAVDALYKLC